MPEGEAVALKAQGNAYYSSRNYKAAIKCYSEALMLGTKGRSRDNSAESLANDKLLAALLSNRYGK